MCIYTPRSAQNIRDSCVAGVRNIRDREEKLKIIMLLLLAFLVCVLPLATGEFAVTLNQTDVKYLRNDSTTNIRVPVSEHMAVDEENKLIYASGPNDVSVLRYNERFELDVLYTTRSSHWFIDVQVCDGFLSTINATVDGITYQESHTLDIFQPFNMSSDDKLSRIVSIPLDNYAKGHVVTRDCKTFILSMTNKIAIISFDEEGDPTYQDPYNLKYIEIDTSNQVDELVKSYYNDKLTTLDFTRSTINADGTRVYFVSPINNAIVVYDILEGNVTITGAGVKDWSEAGGTNGLDCSNDGVINITNIPLLSLYQPYDVQSVRIGNKDILLIGSIGGNRFSVQANPNLEFDDNSHIQEIVHDCPGFRLLEQGSLTDTDDNGAVDTAIGFGARGLALIDTTEFQIIADTNSAMEERVRDIVPQYFNKKITLTREPEFDYTSNMDGLKFRSTVTAFVCNNQRLVTIAGADMLFVFTVDVNHIDQGFQFHGLYDGIADKSSNYTFRQLYDDRLLSLLSISSLRIVEVAPDRLMLVASDKGTGTVSLFEINVTGCPVEEQSPSTNDVQVDDGCTEDCDDDDDDDDNESGQSNDESVSRNSEDSSESSDDDDSRRTNKKTKRRKNKTN